MDPTNQQSVEEQNRRLVERYTEIARLAGGLAHEIKNPLSTIRLNLELLAEEFDGAETPQQRRALKRIDVVQREAGRLQELLDEFLNFSKVRQVHLKPTDLNSVVEELLDFFAPQAEESGIEVSRFLDPELPHVMLDAEMFRGALLNLVINAQQAMPDGGQLVARTFARGPSVALQLIDTGQGMDEKTGAAIFEAFYSTKPGGTGLGLPTAGKVIEAHGGRIAVQSEVGRGTQFTIELPVAARLTGRD
jgi:signal transduction histidine kinase